MNQLRSLVLGSFVALLVLAPVGAYSSEFYSGGFFGRNGGTVVVSLVYTDLDLTTATEVDTGSNTLGAATTNDGTWNTVTYEHTGGGALDGFEEAAYWTWTDPTVAIPDYDPATDDLIFQVLVEDGSTDLDDIGFGVGIRDPAGSSGVVVGLIGSGTQYRAARASWASDQQGAAVTVSTSAGDVVAPGQHIYDTVTDQYLGQGILLDGSSVIQVAGSFANGDLTVGCWFNTTTNNGSKTARIRFRAARVPRPL